MTNYTYNAPTIVNGLEALAWINTVTGGWGWSLILMTFLVVNLLKTRGTMEDSIAPIMFITDLGAMFLGVAGLLKIEVAIGLIAFTVLIAFWKWRK